MCVDLDGTLIASDLLWETLLDTLRANPWKLFWLPLWLIRGRAYLKQQLARSAALDVSLLPYEPELVKHLQGQRETGRHIALVTASDYEIASRVAMHCGFFSEVIASDGILNLKGHSKGERLVERYGAAGFDYIGNSWADVPVWALAAEAGVVRPSARLVRRISRVARTGQIFRSSADRRFPALTVLRPHQWVKNILVFVPLLAAHRFTDVAALWASGLAFIAFSLCASSVYVLNDLLDIQSDRGHPRKKRRPFAAGTLSPATGIAMTALLSLSGFALASSQLPITFVGALAIYMAVTTAYSLRLKREAVADVMILAGLYVLRVVAGALATATILSTWLLAFAMFLFLSLAFLKRYIEVATSVLPSSGEVAGRGYRRDDSAWLHAAGLGSSYLSVLVLAIYVNSSDVAELYERPQLLLALCPAMLYWTTRVWFEAHRHRLYDDPLVAVARDWTAYAVIAFSAVVVLTAM